MNKVMLIGNVGQDPQVKYLEQGVCVAQVSLATTERGFTMQDGTRVPDRTEWHTCIFWRKNAEIVEKYVHKGDKLYIEGKIQGRNWTDKRGITHKLVDIVVDNMEMLSPRPTEGTLQQNSSVAQTEEQQTQTIKPSTPPAVTPQENNGRYPF